MGKCVLLRNYDSDGNLISLECSVCHKVKAVSEFSKCKSKKDGVNTVCKDCHKQYDKEYCKQNADKRKKYSAEWRNQNAEYYAEWYNQNKDKIAEYKKEYDKQYRKQNKDKIAEYHKEHYKQNKDKIAERYDSKTKQALTEIKAYVEQDPQKYNYNPNEEIYGIIYLVHNVKSDKYYIGQTTIGFDNRYNKGWLYEHSYKDTVKTDLELYGEDSFEYTKIFKVAHSQKDLDRLEAYYIDYFNAYDNGYNETRGNIFTERK